ncbi:MULTISPECIES: thiolase C-terminal domain-containing protein [Actinomadura]|uniref:Thiolase C-terminal domain-containing protein n=1 Tax=Actinomadura yumaensis TaxID=111807 RepID=A0ABW2CCT7_9ACTN|nr:hypothetical protein [Actinomadura sp. J1-007]MWK38365.1 hypothetical protein [Actinomadura sp. J1-007]
MTARDVRAAPMISSPLIAADCCLATDGGGAIVLTSLERARDLPRPPAVVLGYGESTTNTSMTSASDLLRPGSPDSGRRAFAMAALRPGDVDVAQLYDSFTVTVLLTLEGLGFRAPGAAASFIGDGRIRPGGDFALNTSGGGLPSHATVLLGADR